jgi:hypothetical protein
MDNVLGKCLSLLANSTQPSQRKYFLLIQTLFIGKIKRRWPRMMLKSMSIGWRQWSLSLECHWRCLTLRAPKFKRSLNSLRCRQNLKAFTLNSFSITWWNRLIKEETLGTFLLTWCTQTHWWAKTRKKLIQSCSLSCRSCRRWRVTYKRWARLMTFLRKKFILTSLTLWGPQTDSLDMWTYATSDSI